MSPIGGTPPSTFLFLHGRAPRRHPSRAMPMSFELSSGRIAGGDETAGRKDHGLVAQLVRARA
jgi:hypothetical protein